MDFSNSYLDDLERGTLPLKEVTDEAPPLVRVDASNRQPGEDGAWNQQRARSMFPLFSPTIIWMILSEELFRQTR